MQTLFFMQKIRTIDLDGKTIKLQIVSNTLFSAVNYSALKVDCFVLEINTFVYCVHLHVKTLIRKVLNVGIVK